MADVLKIMPAGTDQAKADELRAKLEPILSQAAATLDEAVAAGFVVNINIAPAPPLNRHKAIIAISRFF